MGMCVLVLGASGSGKSTSLRNFRQEEVAVLNIMGKALPFRGKLDCMNHASYRDCTDKISAAKRKVYVVDDAGYLMSNENFARAKETGYTKFTDMAQSFQKLILTSTLTPDDTITYVMMHSEWVDGREKPKTVGKMLDEKFCIEGACPIVLDCMIRDGKHVFITTSDGTNLAKAPMDMLPDVMDNDLYEVDRLIREYYGWAPLRTNDKKEN